MSLDPVQAEEGWAAECRLGWTSVPRQSITQVTLQRFY
jgi:hypothetical protein